MLDPSALPGPFLGSRAADRLRQRQHEDQSCGPRAARFHVSCREERSRPAASGDDPHRLHARLSRTGLRRRQVWPTVAAADRRNDHSDLRRPHDRSSRLSHSFAFRAVRAVQAGLGDLGRHQGGIRRPLYRRNRPLRAERAGLHRASTSAQSRSTSNGFTASRGAISFREPCPCISSSICGPSPATAITARRSTVFTSAAARPIPVAE